MLRNAQHNLHLLQTMIDELPAPKLCLVPNTIFVRAMPCDVCGDVFSTKDAPMKEIDRGEGEHAITFQLGTEGGGLACPDCGDRYAPELMKEMRDYEREQYLSELPPHSQCVMAWEYAAAEYEGRKPRGLWQFMTSPANSVKPAWLVWAQTQPPSHAEALP
jgi:hypothetical protein